MENPFKSGDKVRYKDGDTRTFQVYAVYGNDKVSLGLYEYPDVEQDFTVGIDELELEPEWTKKCIYCDNLTSDNPHFESGCCGRGMCDDCYDALIGTEEQLQLDFCDDEKLLKRIEKAGWTKTGCAYVCYDCLDKLPKSLWEKFTSLFIK